MARRRAAPPDPYEHGFEVAQRRRLNLRELDEDSPYGAPKRPPRISWKWLLALLAVVLMLGIGRSITARNATALKANCSKVQIGLGETSLRTHGPQLLHWAVTGAPGTRFVVAIGDPGTAAHQSTTVQTMPRACIARGEFGVLVPPGHYPVSVTRVGDSAPAASKTVSITAH